MSLFKKRFPTLEEQISRLHYLSSDYKVEGWPK